MTKLLNCPFCGGEAEVIHHEFFKGSDTYSVECLKCHTTGYQFWGTEEHAVKAWNRRAGHEFETQVERFLEIRKELFESIGKVLEEEPGKSYEGEFSISMNYPNYYEDEDCKMNKPYSWTIHLDCYVVGPHRHYDWSGKTLKEAIDKCESDIDNWINGAFRWKD